jgi:hypothetical protein
VRGEPLFGAALLVPHHDDELIFLWSWARRTKLIGFMEDAGYNRIMESRERFHRVSPETKLVEFRTSAPLRKDVRTFEQNSGSALPLDDETMRLSLEHFISEAYAAGADHIVIPTGDESIYEHTHHRQLTMLCDEVLGVGLEVFVPLTREETWFKRADVLTTYGSERDGFLISGVVLNIIDQACDYGRAYRIRKV